MSSTSIPAQDPPTVLPRANASSPPPPEEPCPSAATDNSPLLSTLLRMGDTYRAEGSLHQAAEIYFELLTDHEGAAEATEAMRRLIDISEYYESTGELRQARSIIERLL